MKEPKILEVKCPKCGGWQKTMTKYGNRKKCVFCRKSFKVDNNKIFIR